MELNKKEIIQRLFDKDQITFTEALILAESILAAPELPINIVDSMEDVFTSPNSQTYNWTFDPNKTNIT